MYNELVTTLSTSILIVCVRFNNVSEYVVSRYNLLQIKDFLLSIEADNSYLLSKLPGFLTAREPISKLPGFLTAREPMGQLVNF